MKKIYCSNVFDKAGIANKANIQASKSKTRFLTRRTRLDFGKLR